MCPFAFFSFSFFSPFFCYGLPHSAAVVKLKHSLHFITVWLGKFADKNFPFCVAAPCAFFLFSSLLCSYFSPFLLLDFEIICLSPSTHSQSRETPWDLSFHLFKLCFAWKKLIFELLRNCVYLCVVLLTLWRCKFVIILDFRIFQKACISF